MGDVRREQLSRVTGNIASCNDESKRTFADLDGVAKRHLCLRHVSGTVQAPISFATHGPFPQYPSLSRLHSPYFYLHRRCARRCYTLRSGCQYGGSDGTPRGEERDTQVMQDPGIGREHIERLLRSGQCYRFAPEEAG